ncbi:MAG: N-acetylmuramoyl-L-alanine amidase, partial [Clostridiales bacterium]|nr:N-acetylmuramoyl-L-alanine amidase [Clostridiales bacterium]
NHSASSHGAQVFYRADRSSQQWAAQLQELLRQSLDPDNTRQATEIPDTVYLMNHVSCRAVLVECGFLSNPEENDLLETDEYQTRIAAALTASYLLYDQS